jgi:hypothetical protein
MRWRRSGSERTSATQESRAARQRGKLAARRGRAEKVARPRRSNNERPPRRQTRPTCSAGTARMVPYAVPYAVRGARRAACGIAGRAGLIELRALAIGGELSRAKSRMRSSQGNGASNRCERAGSASRNSGTRASRHELATRIKAHESRHKAHCQRAGASDAVDGVSSDRVMPRALWHGIESLAVKRPIETINRSSGDKRAMISRSPWNAGVGRRENRPISRL